MGGLLENKLSGYSGEPISRLWWRWRPQPGVGEALLQFLYDPHDLLHWRALEGLGHLAGAHPEQVRKLISRLLWLLNEDSGSFGWGAAAALGEIGRGNIALVNDIISMFCGFLEEEFSLAPMLWGIGRLAEKHADRLHEVLPMIVPFLTSSEAQVRALTAWALGKAGCSRLPAICRSCCRMNARWPSMTGRNCARLRWRRYSREALASLAERETCKFN